MEIISFIEKEFLPKLVLPDKTDTMIKDRFRKDKAILEADLEEFIKTKEISEVFFDWSSKAF